MTPEHGFPFDPLSTAFAQDPYPRYAALRDAETLYYYQDFDIWLLSRHDEVAAAANDRRLVRSLEAFLPAEEIQREKRRVNWHDMPNHSRFVQFSMLDSDGAVHDRLRRLVFREFTPVFVAQQRARIQAIVDDIVTEAIARREIDFIEDFAARIPGRIIGHVLGVPDAQCDQLRQWSEQIVQYFDIDRSDERKQIAERATTEFHRFLLDLLAQRRATPQDDLLTRLAAAEDAGEMSEDELISTCMLILMAGHGSTIDVLGSGLHAMLRHPDQMRRLRDDPGMIRTAIPEMFRYESPLPFFHRYAIDDIEIRGRYFPKGTKFGLLYGAANRDPAHFPDPDRFDIGRMPNRHLAFGGGAHFCLGNHLARLDMEVIFLTLAARTRSIALLETPLYKTGLSVRGPRTLPIELLPR